MRGLPPAALADLRACFARLEARFGLRPLLEPVTVEADADVPPGEGFLPADDPAGAVCGPVVEGDGSLPGLAGPAHGQPRDPLEEPDVAPPAPPRVRDADEERTPFNPGLMTYGHDALQGVLADWWTRWARSPKVTCPLTSELAAAAKRPGLSAVTDQLAD